MFLDGKQKFSKISVKYMFLYIGHYKNFTYIGSI